MWVFICKQPSTVCMVGRVFEGRMGSVFEGRMGSVFEGGEGWVGVGSVGRKIVAGAVWGVAVA